MKEQFVFRLFIAGGSPNSSQALQNLRRICETYLIDCHRIDVVDVFIEPERAMDEGIIVTPTLVKLEPIPVRRIIGNLSEPELVLQALGLAN